MSRAATLAVAVVFCLLSYAPASGGVTVFFNPSQVATLVTSGETSETISSSGYLFTYTRDNLFTGGTGTPIGRQVRVPWPDGVEAQAVTTPPPGVTDYKARMTLQRVDGAVFDLPAFTVKLLANTGGAGASLEIMPLVNGEDAFADPLTFDVTGYYWQTFSYDTSPNPWGSTALLTGYDTYKVALYVDFAFVGLTFVGPDIPGDLNGDGVVNLSDLASLLSVYGTCNGDPGFNPAADMDASGCVDLSDLATLLANYGG